MQRRASSQALGEGGAGNTNNLVVRVDPKSGEQKLQEAEGSEACTAGTLSLAVLAGEDTQS
eukprot:2362872-Prymnesium_polylepis.1